MCIVADSVNDVSSTKIACFHVAYTINNHNVYPAQLVVYSAQVDSNVSNNAFILPVYNPGNDINNIVPLDMTNQPNFFDKIELIYEKLHPSRKMLLNSYGSTKSSDTLPVHRVGNYKFSIMPSKTEFDYLNRSQLNVSLAAKTVINRHPNYYSFIVYQFYQQGLVDVSPFAYLCPSNKDMMILPTIHGHPHEPRRDSAIMIGENLFHEKADYDHEIYCLTKFDYSSVIDEKTIYSLDNVLREINTDYLKRHVRIYIPLLFRTQKITIKNNTTNRNIIVNAHDYKFLHDLI